MKQTLALPSQVLVEKSATQGSQFRDEICKALSMYAGCARSINDLPDSILTSALSPLFTEVWPHLQQLLKTHPNDIELIEQCCEFILTTIKALAVGNVDVTHLFADLQTMLLNAFITNSKNFKCLEAYAKTCKIFGAINDVVKTQIANTLDEVCGVVVTKLMKANV